MIVEDFVIILYFATHESQRVVALLPDSPRPRGTRQLRVRRIEETPTEQGQFSATGQTIKLREFSYNFWSYERL